MGTTSIDEIVLEPWLTGRLRLWGIERLTDIQLKALDAGVAEGASLVIGAPTSSGKTLVGEIAVLAALRSGARAVYLVSHKALADQKYAEFVSRFGEGATDPIGTVALSTGDRSEGDIDSQLLVATYEKALGLLLSGQLKPANMLVVADELQILGDPGRGAEIETLCSILRQKGLKQFIALTATVENPEDIAGWMGCKAVLSTARDVPLHQEVWANGFTYRLTFGQEQGAQQRSPLAGQVDVLTLVNQLLDMGRGPVLVFTETRREASDFAEAFGRRRPRMIEGIALAEQLELFSEPTEFSEQLRHNAERRVAFHNADLSPQEKQVIEAGFSASKFDVCFATSTLAAGVNFPFRTVVFSRLTFQFRDGALLSRQDYRNMSGRAGRFGLHEEGFVVLLPTSQVELSHANRLILPENDKVSSQLLSLSLRKTILVLVASKVANSLDQVLSFFRNTLYWYQTLERNPGLLERLQQESVEAIRWLIANEFLYEEEQTLFVTLFGNGAALSGLLPSTAVQFRRMIEKFGPALEEAFNDWAYGLIYAVCACDEFNAEHPSRFLPFAGRARYEALTYWSSKRVPVALDQGNPRLAQCAQAMALFIDGLAERKIAYATGVTAGNLHKLATDVAFILEGLHKLACVPTLAVKQHVTNQISMLARRARWGAPFEALDVMRVAERANVPGFGRQRAMALVEQGISTVHGVLAIAKQKLIDLLRSDRRAEALIEAASSALGLTVERVSISQTQVAKRLGLTALFDTCNAALGTDYEKAIAALLKVETSLMVKILDDGVKQNVPDMLVQLGDIGILLECKTCTKAPALIRKEDAWAVVQKSADYDVRLHRVTLGKPAFDETSKEKVAAAHDITLVEHSAFIEGLLRVHSGSLTPKEFLLWLGTPGLAEIERLGGTPTYKEN